jgi:hypothetical protein
MTISHAFVTGRMALSYTYHWHTSPCDTWICRPGNHPSNYPGSGLISKVSVAAYLVLLVALTFRKHLTISRDPPFLTHARVRFQLTMACYLDLTFRTLQKPRVSSAIHRHHPSIPSRRPHLYVSMVSKGKATVARAPPQTTPTLAIPGLN